MSEITDPRSPEARVAKAFDARLGVAEPVNIARFYGAGAGLLDIIVVTSLAVVIGALYHSMALGISAQLEIYAAAGALTALIYTSLRASKNGYAPRPAHAGAFNLHDMFAAWSLSLLGLLIAGFLTKSTATFSRVSILLFYVLGFAALALIQLALSRLLRWGVQQRLVSIGRCILVGSQDRVAAFEERCRRDRSGMDLARSFVLPSGAGVTAEAQSEMLKRAVETVRHGDIDDVFILLPWNDDELIARSAASFMTVPARIHLAPEPLLERFAGLKLENNGGVSTLSLARGPLQLTEVISKRILDLIVASAALVLLSPIFIWASLAIRRDSPGPILFKQKRHGFNQDTFTIYKFRTMTVTEAGDQAVQAQKNDPRVTSIGALLRKTSIDELPQLINVFLGNMSIVGPRPHPTNLDQKFEPKIALYARRHNVKPGITGWAQVNGFRGETDTDDKMKSRIDYDLEYIENWSLGFDMYIIARTFLPKTFSNAY